MKVIDYRTGESVEVIQPFRNPSNYVSGEFAKDKEVIDDEDMTVPDMSFTIPEIMKRFTRGNAPAIQRQAIYESDADFDDVNPLEAGDLDLSDVTAMVDKVKDLRSSKPKKDKLTDNKQLDANSDSTNNVVS